MEVSAVYTESAAAPAGPYSQAVLANGFVFVSGQRPVQPESGQIPNGITAQCHQALDNLSDVLLAAGTDMQKVVRVNIFLADIEAFADVNDVYKRYFKAPFPARTTVACSLRGILIEIDAIAVI